MRDNQPFFDELHGWLNLLAEEMSRPSETLPEVKIAATDRLQKCYNKDLIGYAEEFLKFYRIYKEQCIEREQVGGVVPITSGRQKALLTQLVLHLNEKIMHYREISNILTIELKNLLPTLPENPDEASEIISKFLCENLT